MVESIQISRGAVNILARLLSMQSWYSDTKTAYIAGKILVETIDALPGIKDKLDKGEDGVENESKAVEYFATKFELSLTDEQIAVCAQCVTFFINKGGLNINAHLVELMDFVGITP